MRHKIQDIYTEYRTLNRIYKVEPESETKYHRMLHVCDIIQHSLDLLKEELHDRIENKTYTRDGKL